MEKTSIFRKASLERINSPEQLNEYIKVSRPGIWLALGALVVLLIGVLVWSVCGRLTSTQAAVAVVTDGRAVCYVPAAQARGLQPGMAVALPDASGTIGAVSASPTQIDAAFDAYALHLGGLAIGDWVCVVDVAISAPDGVFLAQIVTEEIAPISFLLN